MSATASVKIGAITVEIPASHILPLLFGLHDDDRAVIEFAETMRAKMAVSRLKGRTGWASCTTEELQCALLQHLSKGDPVDVANFCMMLSARGASTTAAAAQTLDTKQLPALGEVWPGQGGIFAGTLRDGSGQQWHLIVPTGDEFALKGEWGNRGTDLPGADSLADGLANTQAMAGAGSDIAKRAVALTGPDGHTDYYIPAINELRLVFCHAKALLPQEWHWSSTQHGASHAWTMGFAHGLTTGLKGNAAQVRPVRRIPA